MVKPIVIGTLHTRNFEFTVVGETEEECEELFRQAWHIHVHEYGADPNLIHELLAQGEPTYLVADIGTAHRDNERLL